MHWISYGGFNINHNNNCCTIADMLGINNFQKEKKQDELLL